MSERGWAVKARCLRRAEGATDRHIAREERGKSGQLWPLVVLSAGFVLPFVGTHHVPNQVVSSVREAPLARVALDADRPGARLPPDCDGLSMQYPAVGVYLGRRRPTPTPCFGAC